VLASISITRKRLGQSGGRLGFSIFLNIQTIYIRSVLYLIPETIHKLLFRKKLYTKRFSTIYIDFNEGLFNVDSITLLYSLLHEETCDPIASLLQCNVCSSSYGPLKDEIFLCLEHVMTIANHFVCK
jgi:hypothetical protein